MGCERFTLRDTTRVVIFEPVTRRHTIVPGSRFGNVIFRGRALEGMRAGATGVSIPRELSWTRADPSALRRMGAPVVRPSLLPSR